MFKKSRGKIYLSVVYFWIIVVTCCKPQELKIESIELCENFSSEGICKEKLEKLHSYKIEVNRPQKFETWESLANYLYFHSRQTPGFIVRFNRKFTMTEIETFKKTYLAKYEFSGSNGKVEGMEIGQDWIGSFQYLGSMIKERQKQVKEEKNYPYTESLFPALIKFRFDSELAKGEIETKVDIQLKYNEFNQN